MKTAITYLYTLILILFYTSCYEDKGNYTYKQLEDININLQHSSYQIQLGDILHLQASLNTSIDINDLLCEWQIFSNSYQTIGEGLSLEYQCSNNQFITGPGTYSFRLRITQRSTYREVYSEPITVRISGVTGLLVLHGNESESDIGLIVASDFLVNEGSTETKIQPHIYSETNGEKIPGKGIQVIHLLTDGTISYKPNRCYIAAITSENGALANYSNFANVGSCLTLFYGSNEIGSGNVERFYTDYSTELAIRGGDFYCCRYVSSQPYYIEPSLNGLPENYKLSPYIMKITNAYPMGYLSYDEIGQRFIAWTDDYSGGFYASLISSPGKAFDLGNMKSKLIYIDKGGKSSHLAIMQQNDGNYYLAEINLTTSNIDDMPVYRYELSALTDFEESRFYAFGDSQINMCYYATSSNVYRYSAGNSILSEAELLKNINGEPIKIEGEITMMKILKPASLPEDWNTNISPFDYYNYNKILLVGTYINNQGRLYSFNLDEMTGLVTKATYYDGFDRIYDANIKGI